MHPTTLYNHPDGHEITVGHGLLTACTSEGTALSIPIGAECMAELGQALIERSTAEKRAEDESERAGAALGHELLNELLALRGRAQAEAFRAVHHKLHALVTLEHADSAVGGFAGVIVNVLELGIANLPKFEEGDDQ